MTPDRGNLMENLPGDLPAEATDVLREGGGVRIERIVSRGHASPEGVWYDQPGDEWVVLLAGAARLRLATEPEDLRLEAGDWVFLPARCRHRVEWTDPAATTVWLAVHAGPIPSSPPE